MGTISAPCPHCLHDKTLLEAVWQTRSGNQWQAYMVCMHCHLGSGFVFEAKDNVALSNGPQGLKGSVAQQLRIVRRWPKPVELIAPEYTPAPVAKRFVEGEDAFHRSNWNSAVAMYRSALGIATKGMPEVPEGQTFFKRLGWLYDNGKITDDIRAWADQVRVEGNNALHDPDEFSEADAAALRYFTEMFLRYVFELPGKVDAFRARQEIDEKAAD